MSLKGRRVWDCFPYAGYDPEPELLEIRLHELSDIVDYFVLVEAPVTHSGKPKPLYFQENKKRFEKFLDRIVHIVVTDFPPADMTKLGESWKYERHQRDAIARGLLNARDEDIVITSDLDEIPRAKTLKAYDPSMGLVGLNLSMHSYWLNMVNRETEYAWAKVLPFGMAKNMTHCQIRYTFGHQIIPNGGWHFSYMGGPKEVVNKIESFAHQEYNLPRCKDEKAIRERMEHGIDPHERAVKYKVEDLDQTYPAHVLENTCKFSRLIHPEFFKKASAAIWAEKTDTNQKISEALRLERETGTAEARTVEWNQRVWDSYAWPKDGDEWSSMADFSGVPYEKWKDSLTRSFLIPYLGKEKRVAEIGPGHGRWSEIIIPRSKYVYLIDLSRKCLAYLKERFKGNDHLAFAIPNMEGGIFQGQYGALDHMNWYPSKAPPPGEHVGGITRVGDGTWDFIWSFDTFVHIEEPECRAYAREFARVLKRTGMGVIHHPGNPTLEQRRNGCRSQMTAQKWKDILRQNNLHVVWQKDSWDGGDVKLNNDVITMFIRP